MSPVWTRKRLVLAAIPLGILVAVLAAGLLRAGNDSSPDQESGQSSDPNSSSQTAATSQLGQTSQTTGGPAGTSQKGTAADPKSTASPSVLKVHRCASGTAHAVAARLRQEFGANPYVRVVADARTSQVFVMAPPDVQPHITRRAVQLTGGTEPSPPVAQSPSRPSDPSSRRQAAARREVQLWQTTGQQFETELFRLLGERLSPVAGSQPEESAYRLALANGQALTLSVNRRTNRVAVEGLGVAVDSSVELIHALDGSEPLADRGLGLIPLQTARAPDIQRAIEMLQAAQGAQGGQPDDVAVVYPRRFSQVAMLGQQPNVVDSDAPGTAPGEDARAPDAVAGPPPPADAAPGAPTPEAPPANAGQQAGGLVGPVEIQILEGLDYMVIRGKPRDVQQIIEMARMIEEAIIPPAIVVLHLRHVDCSALAALLLQVYDEVFLVRQGSVSITALVKPNALLLIGRKESVDTVIDLARRLDRPVAPGTEFRVFRLQHASAQTAQATVSEFFAGRESLGTRVLVTADYRSNSLIVQASPRDMAEVAAMIQQIDGKDIEAETEIRLIKLYNALADQLAPILQDAISGQAGPMEPKSSTLRFITVDPQGQRLLKQSGILTDVQITADTRANALLVRAPTESMPLLEALIRELDQLPPVEAQIKVFTIINGDANTLATMLETLFAEQAAGEQPVVPATAVERESSLVSLRFAVDERTNSIIATGSVADLSVVDAILVRLDLDAGKLRERQTVVYRLKNAFATDVANAITQFLASDLAVQQSVPGLSLLEQIEREVVIVAEEATNSLIVSATERYFQEVADLVDELDARPPMVMIQVLIAEVLLTDVDEFGVELGLQDPLFFNRSEDGVPGFQFVTSPPGNNTGVPGSDIVASQVLSNLGVGRAAGGLVLAASSEAVSILIRALKSEGRADILGRPQVTAMNNQEAQVFVGEEVPTVSGTQYYQNVAQNIVTYQQVGLILTVRPRISPDRQVVMEIEAEKSSVGAEEEGVAIAVSDGEPVRAPRFNRAYARTVISAADGQTVILGGLITTDRLKNHSRVPWLGELPLVGWAFRRDSVTERKTELLIIMTPHIIETEEDAELIKQVEAARMHWCLSDVLELHGEEGIPGGPGADSGTTVIYPDLDPGAQRVPTPAPPRENHQPSARPQDSPFILEPMPPESGQPGSPPGPGPTSTLYPPQSPNASLRPQTPDVSAGYVQPGPYVQAARAPGLPNDIERAVYQPYDPSLSQGRPGVPTAWESSTGAPIRPQRYPPNREQLLSNPLRDH